MTKTPIINTDEKLIDELLTRSVVEVLPSKEKMKEFLMSGKQMKIYIGADATGPALHLGHATNYIVLEKFRKLGHKVVILIGDFTARIGDPTDKTAARVQLTRDQVMKNAETWLSQLKPIIDIHNKENPVEVVYNHDWLSKMTFENVIDLASNFTVQQMLERDMFEKRLAEKKPIYVHEFFYPLMQGWDSVHLDVDAEMCGNDQKFNALTGRTLVERYNKKEKFVFITTLLENPVTKEKMMSKSLGTGVFLDASANDMFGKLMAQADENIPQLFIDCTYESMEKIDAIRAQLKDPKTNPRDIKMDLAFEITKIYHGEKAAKEAKEHFINTFQKKEIPDEVEEYAFAGEKDIVELLVNTKFAESKSDARRLVEAGSIKIDGEVHTGLALPTKDEFIFQKGKRSFVKVIRK